MERADDAIASGESQQPISIAPNLTPMTGNGNEVIQTDPQAVEEFDSDSKWEITPLEKASYDCSDIYAEASPDQQNLAQAPESASDTNQSADFMGKTDDNSVATETAVELTTDTNPEVDHSSQITAESKQGSEVTTDCSSDKEIKTFSTTTDTLGEITKFTLPPPNSTSSEDGKRQDHPEVEKNYISQEPESKEEEEEVRNNDNLDFTDKADSQSPHHHQDDSTFVLSQTTVDPQMEKMIDNIVEHGGCQQFADTLQQQAEEIDREKEVENIQREISQASNSFMKDDESDKPNEAYPNQSVLEGDLDSQDPPLAEVCNSAETQVVEPDDKPERDEEKKDPPTGTPRESALDTQAVEPVSQVMVENPKVVDEIEVLPNSRSDQKPVHPALTLKNRKVVVEKKIDVEKRVDIEKKVEEKLKVEDHMEDESGSEKRADDKKSLPERPIRQARLRASKRAASPEPPPKEAPEKRKRSKEPEIMQEKPTKQKLIIKVPLPSRSASARTTIATSAPSTIPEPKKVADTSFNDFEYKKYRCERCKYSTDRLNNIVHHKKSTCSFFQQHYADHVAAQVESWKRSIQSPKSNSKRSAR